MKLFYIIYFYEDNFYKTYVYKRNQKEYICKLTTKTINKKIKMLQIIRKLYKKI